jgi:hypothetical protein
MLESPTEKRYFGAAYGASRTLQMARTRCDEISSAGGSISHRYITALKQVLVIDRLIRRSRKYIENRERLILAIETYR